MLSHWTIAKALEEVAYREHRLSLAHKRGVSGHIARCQGNLQTARFRVEALRRQEADGITVVDSVPADGRVA